MILGLIFLMENIYFLYVYLLFFKMAIVEHLL